MKPFGYPSVNNQRELNFINGRFCSLPNEYKKEKNHIILKDFYSKLIAKSSEKSINVGVDPLGFTYLTLDFICYVGLVTSTGQKGKYRNLTKKYPENYFKIEYLKKQIQFEYDLVNFKEYIPIEIVTQNLHEIRGLNSKISGNIDSIMQINNEAEWDDKFENQSENIKKIYVGSRLIKFILDNVKFYRPNFFETLRLNTNKSFIIHRSVSKIVKIYRNDFKKDKANIEFKGNCRGSIKGDKEYFEILIKILIENALKYSEFPKKIGPKVLISESNSVVKIEVHSYGRAIPQTEQPYLFSKGFRSKVNRVSKEGTGMGLYNAKQLSKHFNAKIFFRNKEVSTKNEIDLAWNIFTLEIIKSL